LQVLDLKIFVISGLIISSTTFYACYYNH